MPINIPWDRRQCHMDKNQLNPFVLLLFSVQFSIMTTFIKENNNNVQQFVQFYWTLLMDYVETKKGK